MSALRDAAAEIEEYLGRTPRAVIEQERDRLSVERSALHVEVLSTNDEIASMDVLIKRIQAARSKKARERDELMSTYDSKTAVIAELDTKLLRIRTAEVTGDR